MREKPLRANPYRSMLKALRKPLDGHPKQKSATQVYLHENLDRVNAIYAEREATTRKNGIHLRTLIARELLSQESEEFKAALEARVAAEHADAMEKYEEAKIGEPSDDPDDQAE